MALPLSHNVILPSERKEITHFIDICIQKREYIQHRTLNYNRSATSKGEAARGLRRDEEANYSRHQHERRTISSSS